MVKEENKRVQITIPRELLEKVVSDKKKGKRKLTNLVVFLLEKYIQEEGGKK